MFSLAGPGGALQLPQLRQPEALCQEARPPAGGRGPAGKAGHAFLNTPFATHAHTAMGGLPITVLHMHTNTHILYATQTACFVGTGSVCEDVVFQV